MAKLFSRRSVAVAVGVLALTLAGGGIAAAAQPTTATKTAIDSAQPGLRAAANGGQPQVTPEEVRQAKAALKKSVGTNYVNGSTSFAVVGAAGNLIRGNDAVSATKYGPGQYQVLFNRNLTRGAYVATIGTDTDCCIPPAGEISVAPRLITPNAVFVQTYDSSGVPSDRPFHLAVFTR
ncbi:MULTISPECIES: hypothetical protein [Micromonospora]|uniref:Secreted protein n=1 Tax=Micromonospora yangpuensis TaxID=683228 RepID=A0A1C6UBB7_9ACTN|nr:hypothetical protein [Micromonospora yangpuensis]GGL87131.1 hypothetical protein GCM10012279_01010 [Micromonospora yangpuensis]SCL51211.1 hypothetical protein GA0070617_1714 [Micromonospora yangpuensis]